MLAEPLKITFPSVSHFYTAINLLPETVDDIVIVCCGLHNMLRDVYGTKFRAPNYEPDPTQEPPTDNLVDFARGREYANFEGFSVRNSFAAYFSNDGRVCWQDHRVNRTDQN